MRNDPPEAAIGAMLFLTVLAIGLVWIVETFANWLK
jgi:hypothetical protein